MELVISDRNELGKAFIERRKQLGLTQGEVADRAAVSLRMLQGMEYGKFSPSLDKMIAVADVLGLKIILK